MKIYSCLVLALFLFLQDAESQIGRLPLSPLQTIEQNIGITDITISYCRPSMRGREIFGKLVPFDQPWRTGANRNTTIEFSQDVIIGEHRLKKGKYAIFTIPSKNEWKVIFYADTDNWNVPEIIEDEKIVANLMVETTSLEKAAEVLTISIGDFTNYAFDLTIAWSQTMVTVPIQLTTKELMDAKISRTLDGPGYNDYYAAAVYQMESGKEYEKGLNWINKAIELADPYTWWDLRVKAILLAELGRDEEAKNLAQKGLMMAKEDNRAYGINEFNLLIQKLEN